MERNAQVGKILEVNFVLVPKSFYKKKNKKRKKGGTNETVELKWHFVKKKQKKKRN